jgi:hypothetical protein
MALFLSLASAGLACFLSLPGLSLHGFAGRGLPGGK